MNDDLEHSIVELVRRSGYIEGRLALRAELLETLRAISPQLDAGTISGGDVVKLILQTMMASLADEVISKGKTNEQES